MTSIRNFKYRIYPTKKQEKSLQFVLDECRWVYNQTLELKKKTWENKKESVNLYATHKQLPIWKKERTTLKNVHAQILQNVQRRVDWAFGGFFRRIKKGETPGYPRFRCKERYNSFTYPQFPSGGFKIKDNKIVLSDIGHIKSKIHRNPLGKMKTCTIRRSTTGKWYVTINVEIENKKPRRRGHKSVGIDLGLKSFAVLSDETVIENPRFFKTEAKALAKAQRNKKPKKIVTRVHERIANKRHDFSHQISRSLVQKYDILCLEDLNIQNMIKDNINNMKRDDSKRLNCNISDVAWSQFVNNISYKAEEAGKKCILVNPKNTTQMCSKCGIIVKKTLSDRWHRCPHCKLNIDRDLNASLNILRLGLQSLGTS